MQYFRPSLGYRLPLNPLFCLFLSGRLRHVLLYVQRRFKSACASAKSDQSLSIPPEQKLEPWVEDFDQTVQICKLI